MPLGNRLTRPTDNPHKWLSCPGDVPVMDNPNSAWGSCNGQEVHGQSDNPLRVLEARSKLPLCVWLEGPACLLDIPSWSSHGSTLLPCACHGTPQLQGALSHTDAARSSVRVAAPCIPTARAGDWAFPVPCCAAHKARASLPSAARAVTCPNNVLLSSCLLVGV